MFSFVAVSMLAAIAPICPTEEPPAKAADRPIEAVYGLAGGYQAVTDPALKQQWDVWTYSNVGSPENLVLAKVDDATRAQLGVPEGRGLVATSLRPNGPAWEAGIREQDVLLTFDEKPLVEPEDLDRLLKESGSRPAKIALLRKRKPTTLDVQAKVLVELGPPRQDAPDRWIGVSVDPLPAAIRVQLDVPVERGLIVTRVMDDAPAARSGVRPHDVILTVDGADVADPAALLERVGKAEGKPLALELLRGGERVSLAVTPEKRPVREGADKVWYTVNQPVQTLKYFDVVRPGVVVADEPVKVRFQNVYDRPVGPAAAEAGPSPPADPRLDALSAEVKALREAVEALRKALEAKK